MSENTEELNAEMSAIESEHATGATFEEYEAMWVVLTEKKGWSPSRAHGYLLARLYNRLYGQCEALKAKVDRQAGRIENLETALAACPEFAEMSARHFDRLALNPAKAADKQSSVDCAVACRDVAWALRRHVRSVSPEKQP